MQNFFSSGLNKILNGKILSFQNINQKKYSKFSFDHIFQRILTKNEPDAHINKVPQSVKLVNCQVSFLRDFSEKL